MINTILTPDEATKARHTLGLSQNHVAKATGISRTTLALFEVKKYLLNDDQLIALKEYYETSGYDFDEAESPSLTKLSTHSEPKTGLRLIDGFAVPEGIDEGIIEDVLGEYEHNETEIDNLLSARSGYHWFSEEPKQDGLNRLQTLMSKNYLLTQRLMGRERLASIPLPDEIDPERITNGELLKHTLNTHEAN